MLPRARPNQTTPDQLRGNLSPMTATAQKTYTWGTGRRKTAVARVRIREGTGQFIVNGLDSKEDFPLVVQQKDTREPLNLTDMAGRIDVFVKVKGSGKLSQAGAVMLGLARALKGFRPDLESKLRENGLLTRDARMV